VKLYVMTSHISPYQHSFPRFIPLHSFIMEYISSFRISTYCTRDNVSGFYSEGTRFKSRTELRVSTLILWFLPKHEILFVVLYACETWSLTLIKEHRPRLFENRVPYLDQTGMQWQEAGKNYLMRSFIICSLDQILLGWSNQGWDGRDM
jgi:hypothetical protein